MAVQDEQDKPLENTPKGDFSEWYNEVIDKAGLSDKRYPIKGMNVWTPYGWKIMSLIDDLIRAEMERTEHEEVCFPLLIPDTEFAKEADHIKGFNKEVFWVTHAGENALDVKLVLRPTSETAMYPMFALWVRSHADLPLKTFQIVNTFRYETKQTRPFIRMREIHFFEAHTCHATFDDAEAQIAQDKEIWHRLSEALCMPYLMNKRPDWDKFPGAYYSLGADILMPNGKALQVATIHEYRDNFAKPYDIKFEDAAGGHTYVHQTTYGMSERLLGGIVGLHGDEKGLVLPPAVAPFQAVIVPIFNKKTEERVMAGAKQVMEALKADGIRVHIDARDIRPGAKYYYWELRGAPLRLEVGPRDLDKGVVTAVKRTDGTKSEIPLVGLIDGVKGLLGHIAAELSARAKKTLDTGIIPATSLEGLKGKDGIFHMAWCGAEECGMKIEQGTEKGVLGVDTAKHGDGKCIACGKDTHMWVNVANTF